MPPDPFLFKAYLALIIMLMFLQSKDLAKDMRDDIDICDRTLGGNKFQECFLGCDAVAWLMKRTGSKVSILLFVFCL